MDMFLYLKIFYGVSSKSFPLQMARSHEAKCIKLRSIWWHLLNHFASLLICVYL